MLNILRTHRDVLEQYQQRFKYILVDEYQDTNQVQYLWLRLLAQERKNICVVGDDDQSIYSWRGAEVANILRFEKDFPGAKVDPAGTELPLDPADPRRRLGPDRRQQRAPRQDAVDRAERRRQGPRDRRLGRARGSAPGRRGDRAAASAKAPRSTEVAILVRAQFQTREFEDRFITIGLTYRIVGGFRFYERAEIRDALAYLRRHRPARRRPRLRADRTTRPSAASATRRWSGSTATPARDGVPLLPAAIEIVDTDELTGARPRHARSAARSRDFARWRGMLPRAQGRRAASRVPTRNWPASMLDESRLHRHAPGRPQRPRARGGSRTSTELARAMEEYETLGALPRACQPGHGQ